MLVRLVGSRSALVGRVSGINRIRVRGERPGEMGLRGGMGQVGWSRDGDADVDVVGGAPRDLPERRRVCRRDGNLAKR